MKEVTRMNRIVGDHVMFSILSDYLHTLRRNHEKTLEQSDNVILIHRAQGSISVIDKMLKLRDDLKAAEKDGDI